MVILNLRSLGAKMVWPIDLKTAVMRISRKPGGRKSQGDVQYVMVQAGCGRGTQAQVLVRV